METNFNEIKQEILRRAKKASACKHEYGRAYAAENLSELSEVIKDNFDWACSHDILTIDLIEKYKEDFAANGIYANQNVESGYLLCSNATVEAYGNAMVTACSNATVEAYGNAMVTAYDNATVWAYDGTTAEAYDNATVLAYNNATVAAYDNTTVEAYNNTTVEACDNATVEACNNATVRVCNNAYCTSYFTIDCKLSDHAIYRVRDTNTVYYADSDIKFVKQ